MKHESKNSTSFRIAITIIVIALALCSTAFTQITVTNATFPVVGDTLRMAIANSSSSIVQAVYTPPGGPQTWDLSDLLVNMTQDIVYRPTSENNVQIPVFIFFHVS